MKRKLFLLILIYLVVFINSYASAETGNNYKYGLAVRVRHEYWGNAYDMNDNALDNRNFFRVKSSLWGEFNPTDTIGFYSKLTNEFKAYAYYAPSTNKTTGKTDKGYHFDINEVVFDNLYLNFKKHEKFPLDIRIGRQDLTDYGEGFLLSDGTPGDGSRTFYFNAVKALWYINDNNRLDFIYINDPIDDKYLPIINSDATSQNLNTTDEEGYVLYLKNKTITDCNLEGYYIYKKEGGSDGTGFQSKKSTINTVGSSVRYAFMPYVLRTQLAYQFGDYGENRRQAAGGYIFVDREFKKIKWSPNATLGYIYLSGDNPNTEKDEAWDPLFSRYPWMSELYCLSYKTETGVSAYWTNLSMCRSQIDLQTTKNTKLSMRYNYLMANEDVSGSIFSSGKNRGSLPQLRFDYTFNKNITSYILAEYFIPGDFYNKTNRDEALFLRTELLFKF